MGRDLDLLLLPSKMSVSWDLQGNLRLIFDLFGSSTCGFVS